MATKKILQDIDEYFLQCPICMQQYREPKILPCLHRFCRVCIAPTVGDGEIQCAICREFHEVPQNDLDGIKSDFNTMNIIEYIKTAPPKDKERDGQKEKSPLPMCHTHPDKQLELICSTCGNLPVCTQCIADAHGSHVQQGTPSLARSQKKKLDRKLEGLEKCKDRILERNASIGKVRRELNHAVNERRTTLHDELVIEEDKIKREIRDRDDDLGRRKKEVKERLQMESLPTREQLKREMDAAIATYNNFCQEEQTQIENELQKLEAEHAQDKAKLERMMETMREGNDELRSMLDSQEEEKGKRMKDLSEQFGEDESKYRKIIGRAPGILHDEHSLADIQRSYILCAEIDSLVDKVEKFHISELEGLSKVTTGSLSSFMARGVHVDITEEAESHAKMDKEGERWSILGIAGIGDGRMVITGEVSSFISHITEIDMTGKKVTRRTLQSSSQSALRYCDSLLDSQVATVCRSTEVGIYDMKQGNYKKTNIIGGNKKVTCVAVDHINGHIIVGRYELRDVIIFKSDLEYVRTMQLPGIIEWPHGMTLRDGNLLICDPASKKAYAVSMEVKCEVRYEFTPPENKDGGKLKPYSVCTDKSNMLWKETVTLKKLPVKKERESMIIVQYSQDGQRLLQKRYVDCKGSARCIAVVETKEGEKIVMATEKTAELITYGLVVSRL